MDEHELATREPVGALGKPVNAQVFPGHQERLVREDPLQYAYGLESELFGDTDIPTAMNDLGLCHVDQADGKDQLGLHDGRLEVEDIGPVGASRDGAERSRLRVRIKFTLD
jgi:hypothetical protein